MLSSSEYELLNEIIDLVPIRAEDIHGIDCALNNLLTRGIVKKQNVEDKYICRGTLLTVDFDKANKAIDDYNKYMKYFYNRFLFWVKKRLRRLIF